MQPLQMADLLTKLFIFAVLVVEFAHKLDDHVLEDVLVVGQRVERGASHYQYDWNPHSSLSRNSMNSNRFFDFHGAGTNSFLRFAADRSIPSRIIVRSRALISTLLPWLWPLGNRKTPFSKRR